MNSEPLQTVSQHQLHDDMTGDSIKTQTRKHIIKSRSPFSHEKDRTSFRYKPKRTKSFSEYESVDRDSLSELKQALKSEASTRSKPEKQNPKSPSPLHLPAPHHNITLRPVRRQDVFQIQKLLTKKILNHFDPHVMEKPGDFLGSVDYVQEILDEKWVTVRKHRDADARDSLNLPPFDSDTDSEDEDEDGKEDASSCKIPYIYAIAEDDILIGIIDVVLDKNYDLYHLAELTYWIGEPFWGRGIVTAAVNVFLKLCWENFWWLTRIDAFVYSTWNQPSRRVLEKVGMKNEGKMRRVAWRGPEKGYSDVEVWSMLREEWEEKHQDVKSIHSKDSQTIVLRSGPQVLN